MICFLPCNAMQIYVRDDPQETLTQKLQSSTMLLTSADTNISKTARCSTQLSQAFRDKRLCGDCLSALARLRPQPTARSDISFAVSA